MGGYSLLPGGARMGSQLGRLALTIAAGAAAASVLRSLVEQKKESVAVINVSGVIQGGEGPVRPFGALGAFSGRIVKWLQKAQKDPRVKALVLRVNSPGGEVTASDEIHNEVLRTRETYGKPVVASFGGLAASGAYYLAASCDRIIANKNTLTGSIGVLSIVPNLEELLQKVGVKTNVFKSGALKDAGLGIYPMSDEAKGVWQSMIDEAYQQFVEVVARGRQMAVERVKGLADGRVYTGKQAKEQGLVDEFGDLAEAIDVAARLAGLEMPPRVVEYRMPRLLPMLMGGLGGPLDLSVERFLGLQRFPTLQYLYLG